MKLMHSIFFLRKCNCNNSDIYMDDSYIICNYEAIFIRYLHNFKHLLPILSRMLHGNIKYPATTQHKHITKSMCQFIVICRIAST
jgi:hypothetical protein